MTLTKITANYTEKSVDALDKLVPLTGIEKRTDILNRALQIYCFLEEEKAQGHEILIRRKVMEVGIGGKRVEVTSTEVLRFL